MIKPKNLPRDINERAHQVAKLLTGEAEIPAEPERSPVSAYLSEIGRRGGLRGGVARAQALSSRKRSAIARKAAKARWGKPQ
jgi:hypothetical protein